MDPALEAAQIAAIHVAAGQVVELGQPVGTLLVGDLGYPHLHFMLLRDDVPTCAYTYSSATARGIFEAIAARSASEICR